MPDPIYIHAAARTPSYGYRPEDYADDDIAQRLSHLLSVPANKILERVAVPVDSIFVSNQLPDKSGAEELIVNQLVDSLSLSDHRGRQYRLNGVTCSRIETATNGLSALRIAIDHIQNHSGDTVLLIGGEKITPAEFSDNEHFHSWAGDMVEYIASALDQNDRKYLRCMPAAMSLILTYYARTRSIPYDELRRLIEDLSIRAYDNVIKNKNAFQKHLSLFRGKTISEVYRNHERNPVRVDPLRQLDCSPFNDGAGALLISRHQKLRMIDGRQSISDVVISGCGLAQDRLELTQRKSLDFFPATRLAAKRAYLEAGLDILDWEHKLAPLIVEQHDAFVPLTLINLEDLQLFGDHHEVISFLKKSYLSDAESPLWLNPSGGLLEGHPFAGTAIIKMAECFARLTSRKDYADWAAKFSYKGKQPSTALIQSFGGIGANVGVAVFDKLDFKTGKLLRERSEVDHYLNLGTYLIEDRSALLRVPPREGKIVSIARIAMPYLRYPDDFKNMFALNAQGPVEVLVALVETSKGLVYALAPPNSSASNLTPEEICKKDVFVQLHDRNGTLTFSVDSSHEKVPFLLVQGTLSDRPHAQ
jgi:acetyl-CoA acetyltransferase